MTTESHLKEVTNSVWNFFKEINQIPRPSGKEEKIRAYLIDFAKKNNLKYEVDSTGNIRIEKPATNPNAKQKSVAMQAHIDMVCEKDACSSHNFLTDAIETHIEGDWLTANHTTLGADDGIGVAMQLAILASKNILHPTLEGIFTVDEEVGLRGASDMEKNWIKSPFLINLDTEEEGNFCVGCAGGADTLATFPIQKESPKANSFFLEISVTNLLGGHSGEDIHKKRANAILLLANYLKRISEQTTVQIAQINGGNLRNALPRNASAIIAIPFSFKESARVEINHYIYEVEQEFKITDPNIQIQLESHLEQENVLSEEISKKLIHILTECPHGVIAMDKNFPTLVETSTNLAAIHTFTDKIFVETSQRSSIEAEKRKIINTVAQLFTTAGATVSYGKDYPGWEPNFNSELISICRKIYQEKFDKEALVTVIHAGLECGILTKKHPLMQAISFGPTILDVHSPSERLSISSTNRNIDFLVGILENL